MGTVLAVIRVKFPCTHSLGPLVFMLSKQTSIPLAAQAVESASLAGAVVGACIGTALLYTVVLLAVIFALVYWNKRHRSVMFDLAVYLWYFIDMYTNASGTDNLLKEI